MRRITGMLLSSVALLLCGVSAANAAEPTKEQIEFFETKIRPVLAENCYQCHSMEAKANKKLKSRFYADSFEGLKTGGTSEEPGIVPGDPDKSMVIKAMRYTFKDDEEDLNMPPMQKDGKGGKLPDNVIKDFEKWVKDGAPHPAGFAKPPAPKTSQAPATPATGGQAAAPDVSKTHWAFTTPQARPAPEVVGKAWVKNEIDAFVLASLEAKGLKPNPAADRRTLIRRATIGMTGVPPTPAEVEAFVSDASPNAWEKVVDRLLASPAYGERWARHWLDVARYSDTKGYVFQEERKYPYAYTYRDWVIRAFNDDMPYDQFLVRQIAADHLKLHDGNESLAAMGFLTLGRRFLNVQPDIIDDRIDVVTRGTMALTVQCARCHDHKYDPILIRDYYSLYGIFDSSTEPKDLPLIATRSKQDATPASLAFEKELKARQAAVEAFLAKKGDEVLGKLRTAEGVSASLLAAKGLSPGQDISRTATERWRAYLERMRRDPVFLAWHEYGAIPADQFAAKAKGITDTLAGMNDAKQLNPLVREAFAGKPPASMKEVADRYGALLARFAGTDVLPKAQEEQLRLVLRGGESPLAIERQELSRLFPRDVRNQLRDLEKKVDEHQANNPNSPPRAMVMVDKPDPRDTPVFIRGNPGNRGGMVKRGFLSVLTDETPEHFNQGSGRLQLANAIASKDNPLTARVMVNRVWLRHFGHGIVRTPSDFGTRSDPPSHPALLDALAVRFMKDGWSVKKLQKLVLMSATYQQSSADNAAARAIDPDNLLLWRQNRQRMDFEAMRDSMLSVTGAMNGAMFGRPEDIADANNTRRTIYGFIDRQNLPGMFRTFDFASPDAHSPQRFNTSVPQQALFFLNSPFVVTQAKRLLARPEIAGQTDLAAKVKALHKHLFGRDPDAEELRLAQAFLAAESGTTPTTWQYGYGRYDEATRRVVGFKELPHFTGSAWQGGPKLPDAKLGWVVLTPTGGHAGNDPAHAAIRRWTAPSDAVVNITGTIAHNDRQGDGVRARIVSSRTGLLGEWPVHNSKAPAAAQNVEVKAGDTIDFIVDLRGSIEYDNFDWSPEIRATTTPEAWSASADFGQRAANRLTPWEKYVQVLLESNEFVFVD